MKQCCLAKLNPLQSYFPASVWPDKIQGNHLPKTQETPDHCRLRKRPNQHIVRALLKVPHFLCGGKEKSFTWTLSCPSRRAASRAQRVCQNHSSELKTFCFSTRVFDFFPLFQSDTSPQSTHTDNILCSHMGSGPSKSLARLSPLLCCCIDLLPGSPPRCSPLSAGMLILFLAVRNGEISRSERPVGSSGPFGGIKQMTICFQRGPQSTFCPAVWLETQHQASWVRAVRTGKLWITASTASLSSVTPPPSLAVRPLPLCYKRKNLEESQIVSTMKTSPFATTFHLMGFFFSNLYIGYCCYFPEQF